MIVAAKLQVAAIFLEQSVEVITLHDHVVELQERQALFHTLLIALGSEHTVHGKAGAHFPQYLQVVQIQQPVGVVHHQGLALAKIDKAAHLLFEAGAVVVNGLFGHHLAHIAAAAGVADHGGTAADQSDGLVAGHLQPLHQAQRHKVTHMQTVCGRVKANIKHGFTGIDQVAYPRLVCDLGNQPPCLQILINSHLFVLQYSVYLFGHRRKAHVPFFTFCSIFTPIVIIPPGQYVAFPLP